MTLQMELLTYTMPNIQINNNINYAVFVECRIHVRESQYLAVDVNQFTVAPGTGSMILTIENNADFRSIVQININEVIAALTPLIMIPDEIDNIYVYDKHSDRLEYDDGNDDLVWNLCHKAINIGEKFYDVESLFIEFTFK